MREQRNDPKRLKDIPNIGKIRRNQNISEYKELYYLKNNNEKDFSNGSSRHDGYSKC